MLTLHDIRVWDTGERIDLVIPGTDSRRFFDEPGAVCDGDVDASAFTVAPGFADPHVHFRDPGQTYKESMRSGCAAAASGGYTRVLIMPNTLPAMDGKPVRAGAPGADDVLAAQARDTIDYLQHYDATHDCALPARYDLCVCASVDRAGAQATDPQDWKAHLPGVADEDKDPYQRAHPVTAISDDGAAVPDAILDQVLANAKATGLYLIEHCEHHDSGIINEGPVSHKLGVPGIPEDTELRIVTRDIEAARRTGVHIHFQHVSTAGSFEAILTYGVMAKMNPPLRSEADRRATVAAIADGTVDLIATDHAPHAQSEKDAGLQEAPNGIIGLECAYGVCHRVLVDGGFISEQRLTELMSAAPEHLMGHAPTDIAGLLNTSARCATKRTLDLAAVEHPETVDLVILDTSRHWTVDKNRFHSKARNTPFDGWQVTGLPVATIIGSKLVFSRIGA